MEVFKVLFISSTDVEKNLAFVRINKLYIFEDSKDLRYVYFLILAEYEYWLLRRYGKIAVRAPD